MATGISVGWNCLPASRGIDVGLRERRCNGYRTCPFDMCVSTYEGMLRCLSEDFCYLTDPAHLSVITAPFSVGGIKADEPLICNTRYAFIFNHESPGHAQLYLHQRWPGGPNHFVANSFAEFRSRYDRRIENFRSYVRAESSTVYLLTSHPDDIDPGSRRLFKALRAGSLLPGTVNIVQTEAQWDEGEVRANYNEHVRLAQAMALS